MTQPLDFGVSNTPFHPVGQSPTHAYQYGMERVEALGRLRFDDDSFGEHHSGGYELIACPRCSSGRQTGSPCAMPRYTSGPTPGRTPKSPRRQ
jgi:hypothetical protein